MPLLGLCCLGLFASCTTAPLSRMTASPAAATLLLAHPSPWDAANCNLAQRICHCHAGLARAGLPHLSLWSLRKSHDAGRSLPFCLVGPLGGPRRLKTPPNHLDLTKKRNCFYTKHLTRQGARLANNVIKSPQKHYCTECRFLPKAS